MTEIAEGYQQTEMGVIPDNWDVCYLQDLVNNSETITYGVLKPGDYIPNGIPLLQIQDVIHGNIKIEELHKISKKLDNQYSRTKISGGEIVVSLVGTIGKIAYIPTLLAGANLHRNLAKICISKQHSSRFIFYCLKSDYVQKSIKITTFGSTQSLLNLADLRRLLILVPPLPEQKAIAQALSDVDAAIAELDRLITKKRNIKQGTMQQLLTGKKRLPGFGEGYGNKQTEIGEIPEDWNIVSYGENLSIISGFGFKKVEYKNDGVKLLRIDNVSYGSVMWESIAYLSQNYVEKYKNLVIKKNDILLALNRPITNGKLKIAIARNTDIPAILYQRVGKIIFLNKTYNQKYAFYLLSEFIKKFVEESAVGTDQPFISTTNLKKYKIPLPPQIEEQKAIAQVLSDMDTEIEALEQKRNKYKAIKQGMMQELLTGRTRLI